MSPSSKLITIKFLHTLVWIFFNMVLGYMLYAVWVNSIDSRIWICIGLIMGEGLVLLVFKNHCPLTVVARNYSDSSKENFDIYLPNWLAKYNKQIYTTIFVLIICLLIYRQANNN